MAMRNRVEFKAAIATAFSKLTYVDASNLLDAQGITYGPVQTMSEVLEDKQLRASGIIVETGDAGDDYKLTIGSPINIAGETKKVPKRAPEIGADSLAVLRSFDLDETYIQELLTQGVVMDGRGVSD
jgi:crotonobetainyl-CoA:carnitine CoA-transferase CaiB-like acyl-CoA transferase